MLIGGGRILVVFDVSDSFGVGGKVCLFDDCQVETEGLGFAFNEEVDKV